MRVWNSALPDGLWKKICKNTMYERAHSINLEGAMHRILVVDDEELARFALREILESSGYDVAEACNGRECIDRQREAPFDLIVTDIIMPEKEGVETIIELRQEFPQVKIIAISSGGRTRNMDFLTFAKQFGADDVMAKPFTSEQLLKTVKEQLKRRGPPKG
jgi:CheY-like chemotaxis protein